jgi:hypothetical protein
MNHYLRQIPNMSLRRCLKDIFEQHLLASDPRRVVLGSSSSDTCVESVADTKFWQMYLENAATSGDNRGLYLRLFLSGAGGGGEAARIFTTVKDVAAGTAHGAHISLNFNDTGTVTGLGVAMRATLHIADQATQSGTMAAIQAEIWSDGTTSDPSGSVLSFIRVVNGGDTGKSDVDDDAFLFHLDGFTAGAAKMFATGLTASTVYGNLTASLKIRIGSTTYYIPVATAIA